MYGHTARQQIVHLPAPCPDPLHQQARGARRRATLACTCASVHIYIHTHTRLSYRQATAQRATGSGPRPAPPAQPGPRRSCHTLPPHHPPISARIRYRRAHSTTQATTPFSSRLASTPTKYIHTSTHTRVYLYTYVQALCIC